MRRFESIVMSETEPVALSTLWLREKEDETKDKGLSIWYFGENGWTPIKDFDTNYQVKMNPNKEAASSEEPFSYKSEITNPGQKQITINIDTFDGTRPVSDSSSVVLEKGLYTVYNKLNESITALDNQLRILLSMQIPDLKNKYTNLTNEVEALKLELQELKNAQ